MMTDADPNCALAIGRRIAELGHRAELEGLDVRLEMNGLLIALAKAPSETVEDAHALSLVSWLLLLEALRRLPRESEDEAFAFNVVHFATIFGARAVDTLESVTGMPLGAFVGEPQFNQ